MHDALTTLLRTLFTDYELRRFVRGCPGGDDLSASLPGPGAPLVEVAAATL